MSAHFLSPRLVIHITTDDMGFTRAGGPRARKTTAEGFNIYDKDELRIGTGGGTRLCPFDCNCCFG